MSKSMMVTAQQAYIMRNSAGPATDILFSIHDLQKKVVAWYYFGENALEDFHKQIDKDAKNGKHSQYTEFALPGPSQAFTPTKNLGPGDFANGSVGFRGTPMATAHLNIGKQASQNLFVVDLTLILDSGPETLQLIFSKNSALELPDQAEKGKVYNRTKLNTGKFEEPFKANVLANPSKYRDYSKWYTRRCKNTCK